MYFFCPVYFERQWKQYLLKPVGSHIGYCPHSPINLSAWNLLQRTRITHHIWLPHYTVIRFGALLPVVSLDHF